MATKVPRLRYFMFPGRCYAARIALFNAFGKDGWLDERIGQSQFKKLKQQAAEERSDSVKKSNPVLLTNNLPQLVLADGLTTVCQSHAIARWAARQQSQTQSQYVLYPEKDLDAALLVDEAMSTVDAMVGFAPKDDEKHIRLAKRQDYAGENGFLHIGLSMLERRFEKSRGPFLLGEFLSIGDLYLKKPLTDMILDKQFEGVPPDYLNRFPLIRAHTEAVAEHPLVQDYLKHYKN